MKKIIIIILIIISITWALSIVTGYSLVFWTEKYEPINKGYQIGDTIQPFKDFDFTKDNWKVYLVLSRESYFNLHDSINKVICLKTSDRYLLEKMKTSWKFIYQEADVATVTNSIFLLRNGKIVFSSGIIIDKNTEGLQSREFGWIKPIESNALSESCKQFKRVYFPIIIF